MMQDGMQYLGIATWIGRAFDAWITAAQGW
jgi:hypothetical protein